jgi:internalin A
MIPTKRIADLAASSPPASVVVAILGFVLGCGGGAAPAVVTPNQPAPAVAAGPVCGGGSGDTRVTFPDAALERAVRAALGADAGEALTCARVAEITRLHAPDAGISDLTGIENLVRLGELHVYGHNTIRDLAPLGHLRALSDLNLARNRIEDVAPLAAVRTLTSLDLYGNPITDVAPLGELRGLIRLRLGSGARIHNVEALAGLSLLSRLELLDNAVSDLSALSSLTHLTRLSLQNNPHVVDLAPLATLTRLEIVELGLTAVSDLAPLGNLPRLSAVGLAGTRVRELGPLMGLSALTRLDLRDDVLVTDIQALLFHPTLGEGDAVRLEGTMVNCGDIAALQARDVVVFSNCR